MLSVLSTKKENTGTRTKGPKETSGGDACVCYFDLSDGLRVCV